MQEDATSDKERPNEILVRSSAKPWENVRLKGEDIKNGQPIADQGTLLGAGRLGLMAATGIEQVAVGRRPRVAVLATGSELREPGQSLAHGQIYESNRLALSVLVSAVGGLPKVSGLIPDSLEGVRDALLGAFSDCDVIVTSGGVSVGEMDFIKSAFEAAGGELQFWRVAIKPGRPFVFGRYCDKYLFGLPGNPVSAFVTWLLLVRPALLKWQGATSLNLPSHPGVLAEPLINSGQRRHFVRVKVSSKGKVALAGVQASHMLGSLAEANGLVDLPAETTIPAGSDVEVLRWC
jgi:molybdopterin molybdotransferase